MEVVLALDIGGTKLGAALVDAEGEMVTSASAATPSTADPEVLMAALLAVADAVGQVNQRRRSGQSDALGGFECGALDSRLNEHLPAFQTHIAALFEI